MCHSPFHPSLSMRDSSTAPVSKLVYHLLTSTYVDNLDTAKHIPNEETFDPV